MRDATKSRERAGLALFALFILSALLMARPLPWPTPLKAAGAIVAFLLLPGLGIAAAWPGLLREGWANLLAFAWPLSLLWTAAVAAAASLTHVNPLAASAFHLFGTFVAILVALLGARRRSADGAVPAPPRFLALVLLAGIVLCAWGRAPTGPATDGPDHVATIKEIVLTGQYFPASGLVADGEVDRPDPRKGVLHVGLALASSLTGIPAHRLWTPFPAVVAVSFLALMFALGRLTGGSDRAGILSALLALVFLGGEGGRWILRLGYGAHAALVVAWAATWMLLTWLEGGDRRRLALLAGLSTTAAAVHAMGPLFLLAPAALLAIPAWRRGGGAPGRWAWGVGVAAFAALPVELVRVLAARGPVNPLHVRTMPVLEWGPGLSTLSPLEAVRILGAAGIVVVLLLPGLTRFVRPSWGRAWLGAAALAALLVNGMPGVFDVAARYLSSFPIKLLYVFPTVFVLAALLAGRWRGRGLPVRVAVLVVLLIATPRALAGFRPEIGRAGRPGDADELLAAVRDLPGRVVVAADPWFSALVAAETPHYPVTVLHQHGHPLDPHGLTRLNDLDAILSPEVDFAETLRLLHRYRAAFIVVPGENPSEAQVDFACVRGGEVDARRRAKFESRRDLFAPVDAATAGRIFRTTGNRDAAADSGPAPAVADTARGTTVPVGEGSAEGIRLVALDARSGFRAGETATIGLTWRRESESIGWPAEAHIRLVPHDAPGRSAVARRLGALLRRPEPPRVRWIVAPFTAEWPTTRWPFDTDLLDRVEVDVPADLPAGEYDLSVRLLARPMFARFSLVDLFSSRDRWQGSPLVRIRVGSGVGEGRSGGT